MNAKIIPLHPKPTQDQLPEQTEETFDQIHQKAEEIIHGTTLNKHDNQDPQNRSWEALQTYLDCCKGALKYIDTLNTNNNPYITAMLRDTIKQIEHITW